MAPDPVQPAASLQPAGTPTPAPVREKVRVRFRKDGDLRLVSHHDLMKCFERMFRRAALPVAATKGFNPRPRLVFPLSLALGIAGLQEVAEIEFAAVRSPDEIHAALARQAPAGLTILSVRRIDARLGGQPRRVCYRLSLPPACLPELPARVAELLAAPESWIERTRPQPRRFDLRPYLRDLRLSGDSLEIDLWVTPGGTARPGEVLALLRLTDLLDTGAVLERTLLELHDESPNPGPVPPAVAGPGQEDEPAADAPPTSLVPGPLSFDS